MKSRIHIYAALLPSGADAEGGSMKRLRRFSARVAAHLVRRRNEWIVAALYQEFAKLTDVQLERRGIARGDLSRHVNNLVRSMD